MSGPGEGGPTDAGLRVAVVVPLANEADTVDDFLKRTLAQLGPDDAVLCVLDNVSRDGTRGLVEAVGRHDPRVRTIWAPEDRCVVDAYFRGYREAYDAGARWILEMDGGLSHLPEEIPRFIAAMESGAEFAAGSRFVEGGSSRGSLWRRTVSRGGTLLANLLLRTRMHDMTSGFECFSRAALAEVLETGVRSRTYFSQTEIRYLMHDLRWVEIPITYANPSGRLGAASLWEALRGLGSLAAQERRRRRLPGNVPRGKSGSEATGQ